MKKLILIVGLLASFSTFAAVTESQWKVSLRNLIASVAGVEWSHKLLGAPPVDEVSFTLPVVPKEIKKSTNIESYTKKEKDPTEYDKLPRERQRQFDYKFIQELFLVTRKTEAKDEDLSNWLNTLDQGGSREGIYQALVLDEVYAGLENIEEPTTKRLMDFSINFSQKYLNQTFKAESLSKLNLYSMKRILTEKSLDLLEYYETHDLDSIYRWYAILSAELAMDYSALLKSPLRQDANVNFHYEWAKGMPIQHIKSEFIIKLHSVMNGLQLLQ